MILSSAVQSSVVLAPLVQCRLAHVSSVPLLLDHLDGALPMPRRIFFHEAHSQDDKDEPRNLIHPRLLWRGYIRASIRGRLSQGVDAVEPITIDAAD